MKIIYITIIFFIIACSSGEELKTVENADSISRSHFNNVDKNFNVNDFVDAGWKKSKEFIIDAKNENGDLITPEAKEIWYGFFKRKDIEIRFYENHSVSSTFGKESAEKAISRAVNANAGGGIITSTNNRVSYQSYVVSGNTVILCQDLLPDCILLSEKLKWLRNKSGYPFFQ